MGYRNSWLRFLAEYTIDYYHEKEFLFESMDIEGSGLTIAKIIICDYKNYDYKKTSLAVDYLVKHCCQKKHINYKADDCFCFDLLSKETKFLLNSDLSNLDPNLIFSLFLTGFLSDEHEYHRIQKLAELFAFVDLKLVLSSFSLGHIYNISMIAKKNNQGNLSAGLLVYIINSLRWNLRESGAGDEDCIKSYECDLLQVQEQLKLDISWRYEVIADEWISNTPQKVKKHVVIHEPISISETPLHLSVSSHIQSPAASNSIISRTPFRKLNRRVDLLRSGTDDDPLTAALSVERIRRALNEKQRMKEAYRLAPTPNMLDKKRVHFDSLGSASPVIQESPMTSRPPLARKMGVSKSKRTNPENHEYPFPKSTASKSQLFLQEAKRICTLPDIGGENNPPSYYTNLESSDPIAQNSFHHISLAVQKQYELYTDIVQSEDDLLG